MTRSVRSFLGNLRSGSASRNPGRLNVQFWSGSILLALLAATASKCKCST